MASDLGGSQISALLESVPGIRNVLRSPVADALVNTIRAAVGLRPFAAADADELVQYAVRRGLINQTEGDQVLEEVRATGAGRAHRDPGAGRKPAGARKAPSRSHAAKPRPAKPAARKTKGAAKKPASSTRRPAKKR